MYLYFELSDDLIVDDNMSVFTISSRQFHSTLATITFLPLSLTAFSGMCYRIGRNVLMIDKDSMKWLLSIHQMSIIKCEFIYPLIIGISVCLLTITGSAQSLLYKRYISLRNSPFRPTLAQCLMINETPISWRHTHRLLTFWSGIFILISAITGTIWSIAAYWFNLDSKRISILLKIHQGSYINSSLYTAIIGCSFLIIIATGIQMMPLKKQWMSRKINPKSSIVAETPAEAEIQDLLDSRVSSEKSAAVELTQFGQATLTR